MLNHEKVKSMTKAAAYENGPEKKNIEISNYFRTDYMGLQLVKSGVAYTVAFCILIALWSTCVMEELMLGITRADFLQNIIKILAFLYVSGLVLYEIAIYIYYSKKYQKAKNSVAEYSGHLKKINKFYEKNNSEELTAIEENEKTDEESAL